MTLTLAELEPELQAIACMFKANERYIDKKAYEIVGLRIEGATARLAELCGKSSDWIEDRAKAYKLSLDLADEFGLSAESIREMLPDSYLVAVAEKYDPTGADPQKLDLGDAYEKLCELTMPQPNGDRWSLAAVRASLPHEARDQDYGTLIDRLAKSLPLFVKPTLLGLSETRKQIALEIGRRMGDIERLVRQYRESA